MNSSRVACVKKLFFRCLSHWQLAQSVFGVLLLITISCDGLSKEDKDDVPLIFASASLADVLDSLSELYEIETGKKVDFNFGGSIALANQIALLGGPADGVFFVGDDPVEIIVRAGLIDNGSHPGMIENSLVLIGRDGVELLDSLDDLNAESVQIAIGDPSLAPAGEYARQALKSTGVWDAVEDRVVFCLDVRAAMAAVESGNVDYGIVYKTDALAAESLIVLFAITTGYSKILYRAIPLEKSKNSLQVRDFFDFVKIDPRSQTLFESAGFKILAKSF